jgi:L-ascorbate metabolism protein UlaG (beta-lactamase superfamily)
MWKHSFENIRWLGHASFMITTGERIVYIDPWQVRFPNVADAILITHAHEHHCAPANVKWMRKGSTVVVAPESCAGKFWPPFEVAGAGDVLEIKGMRIEVLPAYNLAGEHHPREAGGVGYVITTLEGLRVYHAGDTDLIPEMQQVKADVVLLPVSGEHTMDATQAAQAANMIKPQLAIPMHWGSVVGSREDADKFRDLCEVEVRILEPRQ